MADETTPQSGSRPDTNPTNASTTNLLREIENIKGWSESELRRIEQMIADRDLQAQQRWEASQKAIQDALIAAEKAVAAALAGAEKAVAKAETAAEKRFESVNEFRAQLSDQANTFLARNEYDRAHSALGEKVDLFNASLTEKIIVISSRLDRIEASKAGGKENQTAIFAFVGLVLTILSIAAIVISLTAK